LWSSHVAATDALKRKILKWGTRVSIGNNHNNHHKKINNE
jgi:hypothetical protein